MLRLTVLSLALTLGACGGDSTPDINGPRIFASSGFYNGNLGGVAGADSTCSMLASTAGLTGTFRAWISTATDPVGMRLVQSTEPYYRMDGEIIANNWADLIDGSIAVPINVDENGMEITGDVWTGTLQDATAATPDCSGYTDNDSQDRGLCGTTASGTQTWTNSLDPTCNTFLRLYCVEQ